MTAPGTPTAAPDVPQRRTLAIVSIVEATSYLVLIVFAVWRRGFDGPDLAAITGPIHGAAFLAYVVLVLVVRAEAGWRLGHTLVLLAASVVPLGGFLVARRLEEPVAPAAAGPETASS